MIVKNYEQILFEMLKPIAEDGHRVYLNTVQEDEDDQPEDFIVYRTVTSYGKVYGDGLAQLRACDCDIIVNEHGTGNSEESGYLIRLVEEILNQKEVTYTKSKFLDLDENSSVQVTFSFTL